MSGYSDLLSDIPAFMDNADPDLSAKLPTIIKLCEMKLYRDINNQALETEATGTFAVGTTFFPLPTILLLQPRYLRVTDPDTGQWNMLEMKQTEVLFELMSMNPSQTGLPEFYAIYDSTGYQIEAPAQKAYTYAFGFKQRLPALSPTNTDNWTTLNAYDALLAGCMCVASRFVQDDRQVSLQSQWKPEYDAAVKAINDLAKRAERDDYRVPYIDIANK